jgi:hypothetical protein
LPEIALTQDTEVAVPSLEVLIPVFRRQPLNPPSRLLLGSRTVNNIFPYVSSLHPTFGTEVTNQKTRITDRVELKRYSNMKIRTTNA